VEIRGRERRDTRAKKSREGEDIKGDKKEMENRTEQC
jgi:hypothetical protein